MKYHSMRDIIYYYYDEESNVMIDSEGFERPDIFSIISPNMLYLFKTKRKSMYVYSLSGELVHLIWFRASDKT